MSHRTEGLEPLRGLSRFIRDQRYNEPARQGLAVILILLYALTAVPSPVLVAIGMPPAVLGMLVRLYASGYIVKNKELAQTGPYALVRHPLYTGNILLVIGFAIANATLWALPLALLFFWFYYPTAIEYEDRKLRRIFGETWERWASETPALVPNFRHTDQVARGGWSLASSLRRNGEVVIAIFVLVCIYLVVAPVV